MALRAAARLRRLKRSKELLDGDLDGPSHRHSRGASVRGSSEPRSRRHSPPPRKRSRSVREHDLRRGELRDLPALGMLAEEQGSEEEAEAGSSKRRKKASSAERHDDERRERGRGRHRQRSRDKDRDRKASRASKAAVVHVNELVRRWQMTPPGKDTPMPMPSPGPAPQYGWHQVDAEAADAEAADAEAADAVVEAADDDPEPERELVASPEPEHSHWSRPEDAAGDAVPGDAPPVPPDEPAEGPVDAEVVADGVASAVYTCEACGTELSGEHCPARADHIKQHPYHCQRCYQAFASQGDFTQHLKAAHPNTQELHHCLLCRRTFPNERQHATHMKGPSHCRMERSQRRTIHTLFRMFTGSDCPRLSPLTPEDMHALDWLPNDSGVIHFYHQATPLQLATEYWHLNHGNSSGQSTMEDTPNPE